MNKGPFYYVLKFSFKLGLGFLAFALLLGSLGAVFSGLWGTAVISLLIALAALWGFRAIRVNLRR